MSIAHTKDKDKSESLMELTAQVENFVRQSAAEGSTLRDFERKFLDQLLHIGRVGMDLFLASQGDGNLGETMTTEDGHTRYRSEEPATRQLRTVFGEHQFEVYVFRMGQHPNTPIVLRPIDNRLGIEPDRWSPLLQEFAMLFSVEQAFNPAAKAFEHLFRHALSVDPHVRTADAIVAALFRDKRDEAPTDVRPKPCHKRVMAHLPQVVEETGDAKPISGITVGLSWATCEVQRRHRKGQPLVRIMDGQPSLWEALEHCNGDVAAELTVDILDILHVSSYVWRAAKVFHRHKEHQEAFARERLKRILEGDVRPVIIGLRRMATQHKLEGERLKEIDTVCGYFEFHRQRMKYDEYLAAGYPIASGVIEGACRHLVKDRMERTGMRWTLEGAQAMLHLRALYQSSYWDKFHESQYPGTSQTSTARL